MSEKFLFALFEAIIIIVFLIFFATLFFITAGCSPCNNDDPVKYLLFGDPQLPYQTLEYGDTVWVHQIDNSSFGDTLIVGSPWGVVAKGRDQYGNWCWTFVTKNFRGFKGIRLTDITKVNK